MSLREESRLRRITERPSEEEEEYSDEPRQVSWFQVLLYSERFVKIYNLGK